MIIFFIAVSQKSTLLFQRFVNEIGACWYGQCKLATLQRLFESTSPPSSPTPPPLPPSPPPCCLMLQGDIFMYSNRSVLCTLLKEGLYVYLYRSVVQRAKMQWYQQTLSLKSQEPGTCQSADICYRHKEGLNVVLHWRCIVQVKIWSAACWWKGSWRPIICLYNNMFSWKHLLQVCYVNMLVA